MNRVCDAGAFCLQRPQCEYRCHFTDAVLEPETRKVKAYPIVPDDIEPVPQSWQVIGSVMVGAALAVLLVICLGLFFTGLWVWSLLI
jgi:hypothetical protein